jgi:hypothetical protein
VCCQLHLEQNLNQRITRAVRLAVNLTSSKEDKEAGPNKLRGYCLHLLRIQSLPWRSHVAQFEHKHDCIISPVKNSSTTIAIRQRWPRMFPLTTLVSIFEIFLQGSLSQSHGAFSKTMFKTSGEMALDPKANAANSDKLVI